MNDKGDITDLPLDILLAHTTRSNSTPGRRGRATGYGTACEGRHSKPAPTALGEPEEDGEVEPEDEEEEPAAEPDKEYVPEEGSDSDSDLASGS
ncbi:hypothetical protein RIF29_15224 [Crotalaria pallida]|uniref:Uncharacterized protein n=1 Tax=Crotalaria pallida TaxID=3830 RepID=A0AAN9ICE8_CROPI